MAGPLAPVIGQSLTPVSAAPVTLVDENGPNDEPSQKDLTQLTVDYANAGSVEVTFNLDETGTSGNNTLNGCALFDTDGDFRANYAVCVVTGGDPAVQLADSPRIYSCSDGRVDRCTNDVLLAGPYTSTCTVTSPSATDPFLTGDDYPNDTRASCSIALSEVGGGVAVLLNVCSYPSEVPHSDPSDCVLIPRDGTLTIVKVATPDDSSVTFFFTVDATAAGSTDGSGSFQVPVTSGVAHAVAEGAVTGWHLDSATCDNLDDPSAVTVAAGATVTCTFNNSITTGTLTVFKQVTNNNGGLATSSTFQLHVKSGGTDVVGSPANGSLTGTPYTLVGGAYVVSEDAVSGYTGTFSGDCDANGNVTVVAGASKTCTITNDDQGATLTVTKIVTNDDGGSAVVANFPLFIGLDQVTSGVANPVDPGSYVVSETSLAGYTGTIGGDCDADGNVSIALGEHLACTITNDDLGLTIVKTNNTEGTVSRGSTVGYELTVTVTDGPAHDVIVTDKLPDGLTYKDETADPAGGFSVSLDGQSLSWNVGTLSNGPHTFSYEALVDNDAPIGEDLVNVGCVAASDDLNVDEDPPTCEDSTIEVTPSDILTEKTSSFDGEAVLRGQTVDYEITVTVTNGPVHNALITDTLPDGLTYTADSADPDDVSVSADGRTLTWTIAELGNGSHTFTYDATVDADATGTLANLACVDVDETDEVLCDQTTIVVRIPGLLVAKTASTEVITISGPANAQTASPSSVTWTLSYTLTSGPVTNAVITDVVPTGFNFVSASPGGAYDPASRTVTWTFLTLNASGSVTFLTTVNVATISRSAPTENVSVIDSDQTSPDEGRDSVRVVVEPPVLAGNPTPKPVVPNTAIAFGPGGQPITVPIELLVVLFLGSLGGLAFANIRAVQRRRR